jgi:hypothetical protein
LNPDQSAALGYIRVTPGRPQYALLSKFQRQAERGAARRVSEEFAMKLNTAQVERTVNQLQAQALPDDHPLMPQLNRLYGEHTFFLNSNGLNIVEPADDALDVPAPAISSVGVVVNVANWTDSNPPKLEAHEPELTDNTVSLAPDGG